VALGLLERVDVSPGVRLLGVSVSGLSAGRPGGAAQGAESSQLQLTFDGNPPLPGASGWAAATDAVDAVRNRFGDRAVGPAALLGEGGLALKRQGDTQWGPSRDGEAPA
jgi:hypothetical protein